MCRPDKLRLLLTCVPSPGSRTILHCFDNPNLRIVRECRNYMLVVNFLGGHDGTSIKDELLQDASKMLGLRRLSSRPLGHTPLLTGRQCLWTTTKHRPLVDRAAIIEGRRGKASDAGDNKSGHIEARENEGIFFLDSTLTTLTRDRQGYAYNVQMSFPSKSALLCGCLSSMPTNSCLAC